MCCFLKNVFRTVPACGIKSTNMMKNISEKKSVSKCLDISGPSGVYNPISAVEVILLLQMMAIPFKSLNFFFRNEFLLSKKSS